jgi:histidinol-phosphate/aromatic aminotransferase/cobyric acid decarboxylase-like protein/adenosyl cobinamide kinase/adenosyl cobinamide phosphate guanylyltransferase
VSLTLVIGGTRSGKSAHAERLALALEQAVTYVGTAEDSDGLMAERIRRHRQRRPAAWRTVQAGDELCPDGQGGGWLIDGLGVWIAGVLHRHGAGAGAVVQAEVGRLLEAAAGREVIVVAEQAGEGMLPSDGLARAWLDLLGEATQRLAGAAARVDHVVAGQAITIAGSRRTPVADALRLHGDRHVRPGERDHAVNVLDPGPPAWLERALRRQLRSCARRYPDEREAVAALAKLHGRDPAEIVPTNGAAEALWLLGPALSPRLAACVHPSFTETEAGLRAHGVPVARVLRDPDEGFCLRPEAVPAAADLVVVGNPASPSGTLDPAAAVMALRAPGRTLVVDEAFMAMVPGEPESLARTRLPDVIVVRSFTKLLSLPGLRVGYVIAPPRLAEALRAVRPPWSTNALALAALTAAARRPGELAGLAARAAAEGADLQKRLRAVGRLRTWPSVTNFSLVQTDLPDLALSALRRDGIAVRPAATFPGLDARHIRITAREPERNAALVATLRAALHGEVDR